MGVRTTALPLLLCATAVAQADFTGHVTGPDGGPLAGADVWLTSYAGPDRGINHRAHTVTDAEGRFVHRTADVGGWVWVVAGDRSTAVTHVEAGLAVELRAVPGRRLRGQVLDQEGEPLAGAAVRFHSLDWRIWPDGPSAPSAVTDTAGWYELRCAPAQSKAMLRASRPGFREGFGAFAPDRWVQPLVLPPADDPAFLTGIRGRLRHDGQADSEVRLELTSGQRHESCDVGSDGTFELHGLAPGDWRLMLEWWSHIPGWVQPAPVTVTVVPGQTASVTIDLKPAGVIVGRATQRDGEPAPKADVVGKVGERRFAVQTDDDGRFRLETVPGPVTVTCGDWHTVAEAKVAPAAPVELTITTEVHPPVTGVVVLPDGTPVAGAEVLFDEMGTTKTDATGHFRYLIGQRDEIPPLAAWWTGPDGHAWNTGQPRISVDTNAPNGPFRLVLARRAARTLSGRVVDREGRPVSSALVGTSSVLPETDAFAVFGSRGWTVSDDAGRYCGEDDANETDLRIVVVKPGWRAIRPITSSRPPQRVARDAVMEPLDGRVAGRVTDAQGHGIAGAQLFAEDCPPDPDHLTGADGRFDFAMLPRGRRCHLVAMSGDRLMGKAAVTTGQTGVAIRLADGAPPTAEARQHAALAALDRARRELADRPNPPALRALLSTACAIDAAAGLAWIDAIADVGERRLAWAAALPSLARTDLRQAVALLPEIEQVADPALRCAAVGGLVAEMADPVPDAARQALERQIRPLGTPLGVSGGSAVWLGLLPALARLGDDRARPALMSWLANSPSSGDMRRLAVALWCRRDLAMTVAPHVGGDPGLLAEIALRLARRDPARALAWFGQMRPGIGQYQSAIRPAAELAVLLAPLDGRAALEIADTISHMPFADGGLRGRIYLAMTDRAAAIELLRHPAPHSVTTGGLVLAAAKLDPPTARRLLVSLRSVGQSPEDDADLVTVAPNLARLDLELAASKAVCAPREHGLHWGGAPVDDPPLAGTSHGRLLAAFCALDPERAIDVAGSEFVAPDDRVERLLFVARTLGGVESGL